MGLVYFEDDGLSRRFTLVASGAPLVESGSTGNPSDGFVVSSFLLSFVSGPCISLSSLGHMQMNNVVVNEIVLLASVWLGVSS
jgi:hypothetical protein